MIAAYGNVKPPAAPKPFVPPKQAVAAKVPAKPNPVVQAKPVVPAISLPKSAAQLKSMGYAVKGKVSKTTSASKIAGSKWNAPDTYYTIRDKIFPGNAIDAAHIEVGMSVWMKK